MTLRTFFSGGQMERAAEARSDPAELAKAWADPHTRFIAVWQSRCMVENDAIVLLRHEHLGGDWQLEETIYLGRMEDRHGPQDSA